MSNTFIHKLHGKFKNNLIKYVDLPVFVKLKYKRKNFNKGYFKNLKNKIKEYEHSRNSKKKL